MHIAVIVTIKNKKKGDYIMGTNKYVGTKTEKNLWEAFAELPEG